MNRTLELKTGCRLHFGLVELCAEADYCHAGLGLALQEPGYSIRVDLSRKQPLAPSQAEASSSPDIGGHQVDEYARRINDARANCSLEHPVDIAEALPLHCGLGAGTQLGVAVAAASLLASQDHFAGEQVDCCDQNQPRP